MRGIKHAFSSRVTGCWYAWTLAGEGKEKETGASCQLFDIERTCLRRHQHTEARYRRNKRTKKEEKSSAVLEKCLPAVPAQGQG